MDFLNISIDLTFNTSSPTQTVMVPILNDMLLEGLEYFSLILVSNDPAATLNPATANINVLDDIHSTLKHQMSDMCNKLFVVCTAMCCSECFFSSFSGLQQPFVIPKHHS